MSRTLEAALARLYVDAGARARFTNDPRAEAERMGLSREEAGALAALDPDALELQATIMARKRSR